MSILDIRPTNEYYKMKKRIQDAKNSKSSKKDYVALLTITEFPRTRRSQERIVLWLRDKVRDIENSDQDMYSSPCRFRLMSSKNVVDKFLYNKRKRPLTNKN